VSQPTDTVPELGFWCKLTCNVVLIDVRFIVSWQNDDLQDIIAQAQQAKMIRQNDELLDELKKQGSQAQSVARQPAEKTFKCPACAEWIKAEAKICKHCRTEVGEVFAAKIAEERRVEEEKQKEIEKKKAKAEAARLADERAEKQRLDELNSLYAKQKEDRLANRAAQIQKAKKMAKSKPGMAVIAIVVCMALIAVGMFVLNEKQKADAEQQRINKKAIQEEIFVNNKLKACGSFVKVLSALAADPISTKQLMSSNSGLKSTLDSWSANKKGDIFDPLLSFSKNISKAKTSTELKYSNLSKEFKNWNLNSLISQCNLGASFSYPSPVDVSAYPCWSSSDVRAKLQKKTRSGSWITIQSPYPEYDTTTCSDSDFPFASSFSKLYLGLVQNSNPPEASYRIMYTSPNDFKSGKSPLMYCQSSKSNATNLAVAVFEYYGTLFLTEKCVR